jgi:Hsp33 protein
MRCPAVAHVGYLTAQPPQLHMALSAALATQGRMKKALAALGPGEVEDMLEKEGHVEVTCQFCNDAFQFQREDMKDVLSAREHAVERAEVSKAEAKDRFDQELAELQVPVAARPSCAARVSLACCCFDSERCSCMRITVVRQATLSR